MKGIILAGGSGTRLFPITLAISKQLLPIYNKPMIYYPISTLMTAGIREILVITTPQDQMLFQRLLSTGEQWGIQISYATQDAPRGLADAFRIGKKFIGNSNVCLILGDNLFHGEGLSQCLREAKKLTQGGHIFGYYVTNPEAYGVVEFNSAGKAISLEEKPSHPKSHYAIPGIYFYDNEVVSIAENLKPSPRGEIEITDVNRTYLDRGRLQVTVLNRGTAWLDTGTYESFQLASSYIQTVETRQGLLIGSPEEIAFEQKWISADQLGLMAEKLKNTSYSRTLLSLVSRGHE